MALSTIVRRPESSTDLPREFEHLLSTFFGQPTTTTGRRSAPYAVDVREDADKLYFEVELPGFLKEDVELTYENSTLTITAERKVEEDRRGDVLLNERRHTYFTRSFHLPPTVDGQHVEAKLEHGVLHVTLTKREDTKPRKIEVA